MSNQANGINGLIANAPVIRTFEQFFEQRGYIIHGTIGRGSYAKVKYISELSSAV
jgi:hypothetical protein